MPSVTVDGFLCFSLHTGSVLLGWIGFASAFFSIIGLSMSFNDVDGMIQVGDDKMKQCSDK
jgi:hypothetical protein